MTSHKSDLEANRLTEITPDRTGMALFRTAPALDRTTLAWIRTTLTMATFGFGMIGFFRAVRESSPSPRAESLHQALVILGLVATVLCGISHWINLRKLRRKEAVVISQWPLSITVAMLLSLLGVAGLWFLFSR
jgi:uncharacterized membrane protein YidH (DUF202 family)